MYRVRVIFDKTGDGYFDCLVYESDKYTLEAALFILNLELYYVLARLKISFHNL